MSKRIRELAYLDSQKMVPSLDEMTTEISSGLADHLHGDVVPRHSRDFGSIVDVVEGLVESVEVHDSLDRTRG